MQSAIALLVASLSMTSIAYTSGYVAKAKLQNDQLSVIHTETGALQAVADGSMTAEQAIQIITKASK